MEFKKIIFLLSLITFYSIMAVPNKDEILNLIEKREHEKIVKLVKEYNLLKNNKDNYLKKVQDNLEKSQEKNYKINNYEINKSRFINSMNSLIYLSISAASGYAAKGAWNEGKRTPAMILSGVSAFLGCKGLNQLNKTIKAKQDLTDYYKDLAIREELSKLL